jgi:hypothetical protein
MGIDPAAGKKFRLRDGILYDAYRPILGATSLRRLKSAAQTAYVFENNAVCGVAGPAATGLGISGVSQPLCRASISLKLPTAD